MANDRIAGQAGFWNPWRIIGWSIPVILLITPAVAMRYTSEVQWDAPDFVVMGAIFGSIGLGIEFLVSQSRSGAYRAGAVVASVTAFLVIWINLAVGMIGDDNPYNLLFGCVLLLVLTGAVMASFKPAGMAKTMLAAAAAQLLVGGGGMTMVVRDGLFSMAFVLPWLVSAALFWRAARQV